MALFGANHGYGAAVEVFGGFGNRGLGGLRFGCRLGQFVFDGRNLEAEIIANQRQLVAQFVVSLGKVSQAAIKGLLLKTQGVEVSLQFGLTAAEGFKTVAGFVATLVLLAGQGPLRCCQSPLHLFQVPLHGQLALGGNAAGQQRDQCQYRQQSFPNDHGNFSFNKKNNGVAKSPPYRVTVFFQDLDIPDVCLRPRKTTKPCRTKFLFSHPTSFYENIKKSAAGNLPCGRCQTGLSALGFKLGTAVEGIGFFAAGRVERQFLAVGDDRKELRIDAQGDQEALGCQGPALA